MSAIMDSYAAKTHLETVEKKAAQKKPKTQWQTDCDLLERISTTLKTKKECKK